MLEYIHYPVTIYFSVAPQPISNLFIVVEATVSLLRFVDEEYLFIELENNRDLDITPPRRITKQGRPPIGGI